MIWYICFVGSLLVLILAGIYALILISKNNRSSKVVTPFNVFLAGVFCAVFIALIPVLVPVLAGEAAFGIKLFLFNILQTVQVFTINLGADFIVDNINDATTAISDAYSTYMTCLFFVAPVMTFGFLITLFKNVLVNILFRIHYHGDCYVFSEINGKTIVLAKDIRKNHPKALILFMDIKRDSEEDTEGFLEEAENLKAYLFEQDILSLDFMKHSPSAVITFFVMGEDDGQNVLTSLKLLKKYKNREKTGLYVASSGTESELLLSNADKGVIRLRRIDEIRSTVYHFLYEDGCRLFQEALPSEDNCKDINVLILGLGRYGTEMMKAIVWYCQMNGYRIRINAFDQDELAEERFSAICPELMSSVYNGVEMEGESQYTISIHSGIDISTKQFSDVLQEVAPVSFAFVSLGSDEENIRYSAYLRMLCERNRCHPAITTILYSTEEKEALEGTTNYRGQAYDICTIGDFETQYSEKTILSSELEKLALARHLKWGNEEEFWQYEYNYRSSMASAVHMKARIACKIPGADKDEMALTEEERSIIEQLEHRRWNTYMRSEGYVFSGSKEKSSRNDLAKMHHDLVDFSSLTEEEKRKDSAVGTK